MTMTNIQKDAYERLSWEPGFIPFRFNCGKMSGPYQAITWGREKDNAGVTDLAALVYGLIMIWFEVKQPGEAHLGSQKKFAQVVQEQGGVVVTIRTLEDLEKEIRIIREKYYD